MLFFFLYSQDAGSVHWPILMYDTEYTIVEQMSVWVTARMTLSNGTLWFPTTTAAVTYDPVFNVWTLFGTETAVQRALNGTIFTPQPDFIGTSTLEIFVKDETRTGDLLQVCGVGLRRYKQFMSYCAKLSSVTFTKSNKFVAPH